MSSLVPCDRDVEYNVNPDKYVYITLIDGFVRSENLSDAKKIFEFMETRSCFCLNFDFINWILR
jgi:pentatricopeptide repeat protein